MTDIYEPSDNYVGEETICPLMSIRRIVWDGHIVHCFGEDCQWWHFCKKSDDDEVTHECDSIKTKLPRYWDEL